LSIRPLGFGVEGLSEQPGRKAPIPVTQIALTTSGKRTLPAAFGHSHKGTLRNEERLDIPRPRAVHSVPSGDPLRADARQRHTIGSGARCMKTREQSEPAKQSSMRQASQPANWQLRCRQMPVPPLIRVLEGRSFYGPRVFKRPRWETERQLLSERGGEADLGPAPLP
jgi:hypothetical protein